MYLPPHFAAPDTASLYELIRGSALGVLVTHGAEGLDANHIPFELEQGPDGQARLLGHIARDNPLSQQLQGGAEVLVIFRAEQGYISPNWYPSKHATHRQVPTWNYRVAHVHGRATLRDDAKFVRGVVARLTRRHEQQAQARAPHPAGAWNMADAEPRYLEQLLGAIVGLEIEISRLEGKFKLGQNRSDGDRAGTVQWLEKTGQTALAAQMRAAAPFADDS
jgi:transcriptional regulator